MDPSEPVIDFPGFTTLQSQVYQKQATHCETTCVIGNCPLQHSL
jgi:hypothetical protein